MTKQALFLLAARLGLTLILLSTSPSGPARAQQSDPDPPTIVILGQALTDTQRVLVETLADRLRAALTEAASMPGNLAATVTERYVEPPMPVTADQLSPDTPLLIEFNATDSPAVRLTFWVQTPHSNTVLSPPLQTAIVQRSGLHELNPFHFGYRALRQTFFTNLALGLLGYASGDCAAALPFLGRAQAYNRGYDGGLLDPLALDLYRAFCLRAEHDYQGALDLLRPARDDLVAGPTQHDWPLLRLWDAYIADSLAQNFALSEALAWDDRNLLLAGVHHDPSDPLSDQLLAELYLLRGRHRLYLYEWDAALEDYNTALGFAHAPARAYYDRGLLYYTQGADLDAAYDDLARYLALETDRASPLVAQAEQYLATLQNTLPAGNP